VIKQKALEIFQVSAAHPDLCRRPLLGELETIVLVVWIPEIRQRGEKKTISRQRT
jgi:hypothetical protein